MLEETREVEPASTAGCVFLKHSSIDNICFDSSPSDPIKRSYELYVKLFWRCPLSTKFSAMANSGEGMLINFRQRNADNMTRDVISFNANPACTLKYGKIR